MLLIVVAIAAFGCGRWRFQYDGVMTMIGDGHGLFYCRDLFGDGDDADHPGYDCDDDYYYFSPHLLHVLSVVGLTIAYSKIYWSCQNWQH